MNNGRLIRFPKRAEARNLLARYGSPGVVVVFHLTADGTAAIATAGTSQTDAEVAKAIGNRFINEVELMCLEVGTRRPGVLHINERIFLKRGDVQQATLRIRWKIFREQLTQATRILFKRSPHEDTRKNEPRAKNDPLNDSAAISASDAAGRKQEEAGA